MPTTAVSALFQQVQIRDDKRVKDPISAEKKRKSTPRNSATLNPFFLPHSAGLTSDPLYTSGVYRPMALEASLGGSGLDSALSLARGPNTQVEYSKSSTYQSSSSGTGQVPRNSYASSNVTYSSAEPWKNNVSSYSYNV